MKLVERVCDRGDFPLSREEAKELAREVPQWSLDHALIEREFSFDDFSKAIAFANKIAKLAKNHGHHPYICILYNRVRLMLWTRGVEGLSRDDFVMAAKIDRLAEKNAPESAATGRV
ncbi:MAG: 4a-hydroxytetrahydrobiopterin dehydratase [Candidatus Aureabacteria bacterium]|nr:4a-hydroxytetrahydrobiopterin dehydratase [Candidatus Auribacterota bacterium]